MGRSRKSKENRPDQAYGHAWSLDTAIARYAAGDGQPSCTKLFNLTVSVKLN